MLNRIKRIIKLIISITVFLYDRVSDLFSAPFKKRPGTCVIFYYHAVNPHEKISFARQLDDLERWTKPIAINDIDKMKPGVRCCAITFDDGFACILDNALPELAKRNIPSTLFVPSACLGQQAPWLDDSHTDHRNVVMTVSQLNGLDNTLFSVGSHCRTHHNLLQMTPDEAGEEIIQSKKYLENVMNSPIDTISFPHGDFNPLHINAALQAGYRHAYSIAPELIYSDSNSFVRGRVKVEPSDWRLEYRLKLFGAYRWHSKVSAIKKKLYQQLFYYEYRPVQLRFISSANRAIRR